MLAATLVIYGAADALQTNGAGTLVVCLLVATACAGIYATSKRIVIGVETTGGSLVGLAFRRSVLDNVVVDLADARKVGEVITNHVLRARDAV